MQTFNWFDAPWACGHRDPVFVDSFTQRCALCHAKRFDPRMILRTRAVAAAERAAVLCAYDTFSLALTLDRVVESGQRASKRASRQRLRALADALHNVLGRGEA